MKTSTKIAVIVAVSFLVVGIGLFCLGYFGMGGDFLALDSGVVREVSYSPAGSFDRVSCTGGEGDVRILPAEDGKLKVVCRETEKEPYRVEILNGVLTVRQEKRQWRMFRLKRTEVTLYLPGGLYESLETDLDTGDLTLEPGTRFRTADLRTDTGDISLRWQTMEALKLEGSTGDVRLENCSFGTLELKTSTGEQYLENVVGVNVNLRMSTGKLKILSFQSEFLGIDTSTGRVELEYVQTAGEMQIKTDTGDVTLKDCDAASVDIRTNTGDVRGNFLSAKRFAVETSTGDVNVPSSREGGECRVVTGTGDVELTQPGA